MNLRQTFITASQYFLFWSWNLVFILLIAFMLTEHVIIPITAGMIKGSAPIEQGLFSLFLFVTPFVAISIGVTKRFRGQPRKLLHLFFGIELPLFFLALGRLFLTSQLHAATLYIIFAIGIGIAAFTYQTLSAQQEKSKTRHLVELGSLVFSLLLGLYVGVLLLIISAPLLVELVTGFFNFNWLDQIDHSLMVTILTLFVIYTLTLFLGLPIMLCILYTHSFWKKYQLSARLMGHQLPIMIVAITISLNIAAYYFSNIQPQARALALLDQPIQTDQDRQQLLAQQDQIRAGLLNAYLKEFRYSASTASTDFIEHLYQSAFKLDRDGLPTSMQTIFSHLAAPFLFDDTHAPPESQRYNNQYIAQRYAQFFDAPIEKAERDAIRAALKSHWRRDGFEAGLIDADSEKVWIERQTVDVKESTHSAIITLQETYRNRTFDAQEILYHFSLPSEAALTGVWLSDDATNLKKYKYTVAPRGAAQKLYKQEVRRRIDPALLEQVGPYQYRLRIFPIPARISESPTSLKTEAPPMYMQLQYTTPLASQEAWPLPNLLEKRNAYWDDNTVFTVNNNSVARHANKWLPTTVAAQAAIPFLHATLSIRDKKGSNHTVTVEKLKDFNLNHANKRYAVLIDTSFSMQQHAAELRTLITTIQTQLTSSAMKLDYFLAGMTLQAVNAVNVDEIVFFGNSGHLSHLKMWQQAKLETRYDAVVLVTDEGAYELKEEVKLDPSSNSPLWLLHLGGALPYAYDDTLQDLLLKSGGGIATNFTTIVQQTEHTDPTIFFSGDYQWRYVGLKHSALETNDPLLTTLAAKQFINYRYRQHKSTRLATLDALHAIAIENSIVTPFSSMIVVVNNQQQEDLKKMSAEKDRFEREVEDGNKFATNPGFSISGVPEPEEWALIFVLSLLLFSAYLRKRMLTTQMRIHA